MSSNHSIKLNNETAINLPKLIESRLVIQANSGGGKSWATRRLIEESFGHVQIVVIDPEGEFNNMRGKYDFVYAGKGGDAPVESRSAALLATRLLELKASAIIDLYELPPQERKHFVRLFLDSMVNAPKELWPINYGGCLIFLDEADLFAPEKRESEALSAVIDMAGRGRKRGYCLIPATRRPAQLNKDVAAECNNKLIGRASLDIDRKRSSEELGFTTKDQILSLRNLEPGEFYTFGPAISREVIKTVIGDVHVKPPKPGMGTKATPPPTAKVRAILSKLADLPAEAVAEARTVTELKAEITRLKRNNKVPGATTQIDIRKELEPHLIALASERNAMSQLIAQWEQYSDRLRDIALRASIGLADAIKELRKPSKEPAARYSGKMPRSAPERNAVQHIPAQSKAVTIPTDGLSGPEQRILDAIAWLESLGIAEPEQTAVAFLAGYTYGGGGFNNPRGSLRTKGLVEYRGGKIALSDSGRSIARIPDTPLTTDELHAKVLAVLPGPERKLLSVLLEIYPDDVSKDVAEEIEHFPLEELVFCNRGRGRPVRLVLGEESFVRLPERKHVLCPVRFPLPDELLRRFPIREIERLPEPFAPQFALYPYRARAFRAPRLIPASSPMPPIERKHTVLPSTFEVRYSIQFCK